MTNDGWGSFKTEPIWPILKENETFKIEPETKRTAVSYCEDIHTVTYIPVGDLGVLIGDDRPYRIVHVPTRGRFDHAIPHGQWTDEELIEWCKKVQKWDEINFKVANDWKDLKLVSDTDDWSNDDQVRARGRILDWCRSVKVR